MLYFHSEKCSFARIMNFYHFHMLHLLHFSKRAYVGPPIGERGSKKFQVGMSKTIRFKSKMTLYLTKIQQTVKSDIGRYIIQSIDTKTS